MKRGKAKPGETIIINEVTGQLLVWRGEYVLVGRLYK